MRNAFAVAIGYCLVLLTMTPLAAQELPPCGIDRSTSLTVPWAGAGDLWCVERVVDLPERGPVGLTALAPVGDVLYAVDPIVGELVLVDDTDDDGLPDTTQVIADALAYPTALTAHEDVLYIGGRSTLYRYDMADNALTVLTDGLPGGVTGYPTGGLYVDGDWLYVGVGGDFDCTEGRGAVWRLSLDGADRERFADGIAYPSAITRYDGQLLVADGATDAIYELTAGTDYGACSGEAPPESVATFEEDAAPISMAPNPYGLFPLIEGRLLVALRGSVGNVIVPGYEVVALDLSGDTPPETVLPRNSPQLDIADQRIHIQGSGFYPHHVYGVAVNDRGWVYVSYGNGRVLAMRPLN
ncbi:MAG: hypothetical protein AAF125_11510 [Chloroflexota bacterium]